MHRKQLAGTKPAPLTSHIFNQLTNPKVFKNNNHTAFPFPISKKMINFVAQKRSALPT